MALIKLISTSGGNHLNPHLIFSMNGYFSYNLRMDLWNIILQKMKKYDIKSLYVTMMNMRRLHLITKGSVAVAFLRI